MSFFKKPQRATKNENQAFNKAGGFGVQAGAKIV